MRPLRDAAYPWRENILAKPVRMVCQVSPTRVLFVATALRSMPLTCARRSARGRRIE